MPQSILTLQAAVTRRTAAVQPELQARLADLQQQTAEPEPTTTKPEPPPVQDRPKRGPHELQIEFLTANLGHPVTVFLMNGIKLVGKLRQFDVYTLLLSGDAGDSLIFKHATSTIIPGASVVSRERRTPFGRRPEWTA